MRFKFYGTENKWLKLKPLSRPDEEERNFLRNTGEFSDYRAVKFENHLKEIEKWNKFFARFNGKRIGLVLRQEGVWYGRVGLPV